MAVYVEAELELDSPLLLESCQAQIVLLGGLARVNVILPVVLVEAEGVAGVGGLLYTITSILLELPQHPLLERARR